jgi:hypothetical protein
MSFRTPTHCRVKLLRNSQKERGPEHTHLVKEAREFARPLELAFAMDVVNDTNCDDKQINRGGIINSALTPRSAS